VDAIVPGNLYSASHLAAFRGHLDILRLLVEEGGCSVNKVAPDGATPLMLAAYAGHGHVVQYLLQQQWLWYHQRPQNSTCENESVQSLLDTYYETALIWRYGSGNEGKKTEIISRKNSTAQIVPK
jgi:ankyrin repeat protein